MEGAVNVGCLGISFAILAALSSAGCSRTMMVKDGATQEQFQAEHFDCEQKVITMYGGYAQMGAGHAIMARGDIQRCLESKGWRLQQQ